MALRWTHRSHVTRQRLPSRHVLKPLRSTSSRLSKTHHRGAQGYGGATDLDAPISRGPATRRTRGRRTRAGSGLDGGGLEPPGRRKFAAVLGPVSSPRAETRTWPASGLLERRPPRTAGDPRWYGAPLQYPRPAPRGGPGGGSSGRLLARLCREQFPTHPSRRSDNVRSRALTDSSSSRIIGAERPTTNRTAGTSEPMPILRDPFPEGPRLRRG